MGTSRLRRATLVVIGAATLALAAFAVPASASVPKVDLGCNSKPDYTTGVDGTFVAQGVNIHNGPYLSCSVNGLGYKGDDVEVRCHTIYQHDGTYWSYLVDKTTGVSGWSEDPFLTVNGTPPACAS